MVDPPRFAVVSPYVAQWVLRHAGIGSSEVRTTSAWLRSVGRSDLAAQLVDGRAQLEASAEQHRAAQVPLVPLNGTARPVIARSGAESVMEEVTVLVAAELLGCSPGLVRRLCRSGQLSARQHGRPWLIQRTSVQDLIEAKGHAA